MTGKGFQGHEATPSSRALFSIFIVDDLTDNDK